MLETLGIVLLSTLAVTVIGYRLYKWQLQRVMDRAIAAADKFNA